MIDFPIFYPKTLFQKKEFLFYLLKTHKNRTFNSYFKSYNFDFKNKDDIKLINSLFNFSLSVDNFKSCFFIFKNTIRDFKREDIYDNFTRMLLKVSLKNPELFNSYIKVINENWIDFYNNRINNYRVKCYPKIKKSYNRFMNHYESLYNFFLENKDSKKILLLMKTFYPEEIHDHQKIRNVATFYLQNNCYLEIIDYMKLMENEYKNKIYINTDLKQLVFDFAFENEMIELLSYFIQSDQINQVNISEYKFKQAITKESKYLLSLVMSEKYYFNTIIKNLINDEFFFDCPFYFCRIESNEFTEYLLKSITEYFTKDSFAFLNTSMLSEKEKENLSLLSSMYKQVLQMFFMYRKMKDNDWNVYKSNIQFDLMTFEDIEYLLNKYYLNNYCFDKLIELINQMRNKNKKENILDLLDKLVNAKKIQSF